MEIKVFYVPGISHFSYAVIGQKGIAVIDPKREIDDYLKLQREALLPITHILVTHHHADFISGHILLADATNAEVRISENTAEGEEIELGDVVIKAVKTPGHTPEHTSFLLYEKAYGLNTPFAVFSGDSLFSGDVGRPDLFGPEMQEELTRALFETVSKYKKLPEHTLVYPAHGAGSFCGKKLSQRCPTTIGYEKLNNPMLRCRDYGEFTSLLFKHMPTPPPYYFTTSKRNRTESGLNREPARLKSLPLKTLADKTKTVIDLRDQAAFAAYHIPGSLNIAADAHFATGAGFALNPENEIVLVGSPADIAYARSILYMMGFDKISGLVEDAVESWRKAALPHESFPYLPPEKAFNLVKEDKAVIVDVRTESEYEEEHIPSALHIPLVKLKAQIDKLPRNRLIIFQCGHGCRGSLAASILQREGFPNVANMAGGLLAWKAKGFPVNT